MLFKKLKFARAFFRLVNDPTKTEAVFDIADSAMTDSPGIRHALAKAKESPEFVQMLNERYVPPVIDLEKLLTYPQNTLGYAYAKFMKENNLDPNFYRTPKGSAESVYLMTRGRQTHDFWHVALGFTTDEADEFALQAFMLGQFEPGLSMIILAAAFLRTVTHFPEKIHAFMESVTINYERAKRAKPLIGVKWEEELSQDLQMLRSKLNIETVAKS